MDRLRRFTLFFSLALFLAGPPAAWAAAPPLTATVNGTLLGMDAHGFLADGRSYLPVRAVSEVFGATAISWDPAEQTARVWFGEQALTLQVDRSEACWDGDPLALAAPVVQRQGRLFVPVSDLRGILDFQVTWDTWMHRADITHPDREVPEHLAADDPDPECWMWLARIVEVEARGKPLDHRIAVANVVLNRVRSPRFPGTVREVIFQVNTHVQFPPAHRAGFPDTQPHVLSWHAAKAALFGVNNIGECLFFNNRPFLPSHRLYTVMNGEYFYL